MIYLKPSVYMKIQKKANVGQMITLWDDPDLWLNKLVLK